MTAALLGTAVGALALVATGADQMWLLWTLSAAAVSWPILRYLVSRLRLFGFTLLTTPHRSWPPLIVLSFQLTGAIAGKIDTLELLIIVLSVALTVILLTQPSFRLSTSPISTLNGLLLLAFFVSLLGLGGLGAGSMLRRVKALLLFFLVLQVLVRYNALSRLLLWSVLISLASAVLAIIQALTWLLLRVRLNLLPVEELIINVEMTPWGLLIRSPGLTFGYPALGYQLGIALMIVLSARLTPSTVFRRHHRKLEVTAVVLGVGLLATLSKPVMLGCVLGLGFLLIARKPARILGAAVAMTTLLTAATITAVLAPGGITSVIDRIEALPKAEIDRIRLNRDTIERLAGSDYLWTGRGIGAGHRFTGQHRHWPAHNEFLLITAELGLPGLILYALVFAWITGRLVALNWMIRDGPRVIIVRSLTCGYIIALAQAQFNAGYLEPSVWILFAAIEALWIRTQRRLRLSHASAIMLTDPPSTPSPRNTRSE